MKVRLLISAAILIVPTIVTAQGGMGGMGGGGRRGGRGGGRGDEHGSDAAKANELKSDDIQKLNPAKVLLDKRKDLKIDDAQKAQLETIANRYDWNTRVFVGVVDSLQSAGGGRTGRGRMKGRAGGDDSPPDTSRTSADDDRRARSALIEALQSVRQEYDTASARSLNVLTDAQRKQAAKLIEKPTEEIGNQLEKAGLVMPLGKPPAGS